jgi:hypothetical protein
VRPSRFRVGAAAKDQPNTLKATLLFSEFLGDVTRHHFKAGRAELFCDVGANTTFAAGDDVLIGWDDGDMKVFR